jgi:hypothetical protein
MGLVVTQSTTTPPTPNPQPVVIGANALTITKPSGSALFGNVAVVMGDSVSTTAVIATTATLATDPRGRWEKFRGLPQEQTQANLSEQATGIVTTAQSPQILYEFSLEPHRFFTDSDYALGETITVVRPATVVYNTSNPTSPIVTVPAQSVICDVVTQTITQSFTGLVTVRMQALEVEQP